MREMEQHRSLSFSSLLKIPAIKAKYKNEVELLPVEELEYLKPFLWELGMDIHKQMVVDACKHRNLDDEVVLGYRYMGFERTDPAWLNSGYASLGAHICSTPDHSLRAELFNMARQGIGSAGYEAMCSESIGNVKRPTAAAAAKELEPDYMQTAAMLDVLTNLKNEIRGGKD